MIQALNTLYVTTPHTYLHLDHDTVRAEVKRQLVLQAPLLHLGGLVCFGDVLISPALLHRCAEDGRTVVLLDQQGRFKARLEGPVSGNVLLRRAQHEALTDPARALAIARACVAGKIRNSRLVLLRGAREAAGPDDAASLAEASTRLGELLTRLPRAATLDEARGQEGAAAQTYFGVFDHLVREERAAFRLEGRTRRPPIGRLNALLSFLYTLVQGDCQSALEGVGLDPQVGFLHALRPGRPALALDLMEELRPLLADRLALTLINRRQLRAADFVELPGGAMRLTDGGRRTVLVAYQTRKQEETPHPVLEKRVAFGLVPHIQARLLARHLRGDLEHYPPFLAR
jgi:CRISPR-associated protein Cas1